MSQAELPSGADRPAESEVEREARYFAGYVAHPDSEDAEFEALDRLAAETLARSEDPSER